MNLKRRTRTERILKVLLILTWVVFIGLMIEAGVILFSYCISLFNPEAARNLYLGLDFYNLSQFNYWHYTLSVFFLVALSSMKAIMFLLAIKILSKVNVMNPFKIEVARLIERIVHILLATWFIAILANLHTQWLEKTGEFHGTMVSTEFVYMAGLMFIISQVFKRGVEIQSENELTV